MIFNKKQKIILSTGIGTGSTRLSAFDAALHDAGVFNYNLIHLSSVIPANAEVLKVKYRTKPGEHGHKLYCVIAEIRSAEKGKFIGAALGWYQTEEDKKGIFVEHMEIGKTRKEVEANLKESITAALSEMCKARNYKYNDDSFNIEYSISEIEEKPTSVLVIAVYKTEGWG